MIERYTLPEMGRVWSEAHKYELWCKVETLVLEAHAAAGVVPADAVEPVRNAAPPTPEAVAEIEAVTQHDVIAFLSRLGGQHRAARGRRLRALRHDVVGPARHRAGAAARRRDRHPAGQGRRAGRRAARPRARAPRHAAGRAHPRHPRRARRLGPPGRRLRVRDGPLPRPAARGARGRRRAARSPARSAPTPTSTRRSSARSPPRSACRPADVATQVVIRDGITEWVSALADHGDGVRGDRPRGAARPAHRGARAVGAVRQGAEGLLGDAAQEEPDHLASGSPAWPASSAPRSCRCMEGIPLWHERDISHSSTERIALPDAAIGTDYLLNLTLRLVDRPGRRRRPDARQPRLHRRPDLHLDRAARAGRDGAVPRGRVRAHAGGGDGDLGDRRPVPRDAAQARRRPAGSSSTRRGSTRSAGRSATSTRLDGSLRRGWRRCRDAGSEGLHATCTPARSATSTRSATTEVLLVAATASRRTTSCCRPRSRTRARSSPRCRCGGSTSSPTSCRTTWSPLMSPTTRGAAPYATSCAVGRCCAAGSTWCRSSAWPAAT